VLLYVKSNIKEEEKEKEREDREERQAIGSGSNDTWIVNQVRLKAQL
jgi:hypothetical protein